MPEQSRRRSSPAVESRRFSLLRTPCGAAARFNGPGPPHRRRMPEPGSEGRLLTRAAGRSSSSKRHRRRALVSQPSAARDPTRDQSREMPLAREPSRRAAAGGWTAAALTIASGVLYGVSFPPLALRPLAWVALVPWLVAIRAGSARRAVLLGVLWAHVETFVTSDCLPGAVVNYYQQSAAIGWLMLEGATLVTMVPWYGAFALAYRILARAHPAFVPLTAAAAWCACELARVEVLGGNPWAISGYSQVGVLPIMQIADLAGVHGISFAIAATNAAVAELWAARDAPGDRRAARRGAMS